MKLHYSNMSSSSRRVSLTVAHLGLELEHVAVDLSKDRTALTKLNPNAKIPVLEDGDFVLWESQAIMQYLCERTPGQRLLPSEPRAKADVQRWMFWTAAHLSPAVGHICFERMWKGFIGQGGPDESVVARHLVFFTQFMKVLDAHLGNREWVSGESLSLADFSIAATLMYQQRAELPVEPYGNVRRWQSTVHELPAWKQTTPNW
jgi:glutathione S-transferase